MEINQANQSNIGFGMLLGVVMPLPFIDQCLDPYELLLACGFAEGISTTLAGIIRR